VRTHAHTHTHTHVYIYIYNLHMRLRTQPFSLSLTAPSLLSFLYGMHYAYVCVCMYVCVCVRVRVYIYMYVCVFSWCTLETGCVKGQCTYSETTPDLMSSPMLLRCVHPNSPCVWFSLLFVSFSSPPPPPPPPPSSSSSSLARERVLERRESGTRAEACALFHCRAARRGAGDQGR